MNWRAMCCSSGGALPDAHCAVVGAKCRRRMLGLLSVFSSVSVAVLWVSALVVLACRASEPPPPRSPVSPQESLTHLVIEPGLAVELVAHEPNVIDPVAVRFDEKGRMWVVEMRDYPTATTRGIQHRSRISILSDRDDDGFYEHAAVFADDLPYATGLQPWRGGVFVTMAGQVAYLRDTDGDDRADEVEPWYTGFAQKNTQLRANHPQLALDNHIYIANGLRGGEIVDARQKAGAKPLSISGRDFRFNPLTRACEAVSGMGQFGLTFDDYNNRFVCTNRNPAIHVVLEDWHLRKNPLVAVSAVTTDVARAEANSRVFAIGPSWTTSHLHAGQFTAACGVHIYRADALPPQYYGNLFVCEPTGHLVHREIVKPRGVTFESRPAEEGKEFLASRDGWFSPVNLETGPDGALYVVDMYRKVIEHPEWMPTELRERTDLAEGNDRGRIYRVVPQGFQKPRERAVAPQSSEEWLELLAHPNAWWRETAARLLLERQDNSLGEKMRTMALHHESHWARIHALWLLKSMKLVDEELLGRLLDDSNPRVVEQAIVVADTSISEMPRLRERIARLAEHKDARVRYQALLTAQPLPVAPRYPIDRWEEEAMLIAAGDRGGEALVSILEQPGRLEANVQNPRQFVARLAQVTAASKNEQQQVLAVGALVDHAMYSSAGLAALFAEMARGGTTVSNLRPKLDAKTNRNLDQLIRDARRVAADTEQPEDLRLEAISLLSFAEGAAEILRQAALVDPSQAVRVQAIEGLARQSDVEAWRTVLEHYSEQTPAARRAILAGALTDARRARLFLGELAAGRIQLTEVDLDQARQLLQKMYGEAIATDREKALADYRVVLELKSDAARGRAVFERNCATCHQVAGIGVSVAPDISDSREKTFEQLLTDIIQPNRAIDANYFSYSVTTVDGMIYTGVLAAETSTSVTLKQAEGKEITLRRAEIDEIRSDGVSFMPDGLEKNIPPQDMADLLGFIKHWRYLEGGQDLPVVGK
jgi:putative membrane-bound dehydrogenase-like protein